MDAVTRALLDTNRKLRTALEAVRDGHQASIAFLAGQEVGVVRMPESLTEALSLATQVAQVALLPPGRPELRNTLLRRLLLTYGDHRAECPLDPCECSWLAVHARIEEDTVPIDREDDGLTQIP